MRKVSLVFFICFVFLFLMLTPISLASDEDVVELQVYVVCLDGVSTFGVDNVSRVVEGVVKASNVSEISYLIGWEQTGLYGEPVFGEVCVDVHVDVVTDWVGYRSLVESGVNVLIVNGHGEILPIPTGYTKGKWIDKIADAMAYRNVTWIHVAGYPFYNYSHQESGEEVWGEEGFKRLMSHIGKTNVTCRPPDYPGAETDLIRLTPAAENQLMGCGFTTFVETFWVNFGYPIKESDLKNHVVSPPIHCCSYMDEEYYPSAVVKFAGENETCGFGFYVHFGAGQTYDYDKGESERDFYGAYAAAAAAIWTCAMKEASLEAILEAEAAVDEARTEGRTKGLDEAVDLLKKAKESYLSNNYASAINEAKKTKKAADKAINPSFFESHGLIIGILSIIGAATGGSIAIIWRNNKRKNSEMGSEEK